MVVELESDRLSHSILETVNCTCHTTVFIEFILQREKMLLQVWKLGDERNHLYKLHVQIMCLNGTSPVTVGFDYSRYGVT